MKIDYANKKLVLSSKEYNLEQVVNNDLAKLSGQQIADFFLNRKLKLPRNIRTIALRSVLNDEIVNSKKQKLTDEQRYRLLNYPLFTEYQLEIYFNIFCTEKKFQRYKSNLWYVILSSNKELDITDGEVSYLRSLPKLGREEKFLDFQQALFPATVDFAGYYDAQNETNFKRALYKGSTLVELRELGKKYSLSIPRRLKKKEVLEIVFDNLRSNNLLTPQLEEELSKKPVVLIERYAKNSGIPVSTELKKEDLIAYILRKLKSSKNFNKTTELVDIHFENVLLPFEFKPEFVLDNLEKANELELEELPEVLADIKEEKEKEQKTVTVDDELITRLRSEHDKLKEEREELANKNKKLAGMLENLNDEVEVLNAQVDQQQNELEEDNYRFKVYKEQMRKKYEQEELRKEQNNTIEEVVPDEVLYDDFEEAEENENGKNPEVADDVSTIVNITNDTEEKNSDTEERVEEPAEESFDKPAQEPIEEESDNTETLVDEAVESNINEEDNSQLPEEKPAEEQNIEIVENDDNVLESDNSQISDEVHETKNNDQVLEEPNFIDEKDIQDALSQQEQLEQAKEQMDFSTSENNVLEQQDSELNPFYSEKISSTFSEKLSPQSAEDFNPETDPAQVRFPVMLEEKADIEDVIASEKIIDLSNNQNNEESLAVITDTLESQNNQRLEKVDKLIDLMISNQERIANVDKKKQASKKRSRHKKIALLIILLIVVLILAVYVVGLIAVYNPAFSNSVSFLKENGFFYNAVYNPCEQIKQFFDKLF